MTRAQAYQHLAAAYEAAISEGMEDYHAESYIKSEIQDVARQAGLDHPEVDELIHAGTQFCKALQEVQEQFSNMYHISEKYRGFSL